MAIVLNLKEQQKKQGEEAENKPNTPETSAITWQAPEYTHYFKTSDWYWSVGILTLALFAVGLIMRNFLFSLLVVIAGFTVAMYGAKKPRTVTFSIDLEGLRIGDTLHPFETLKSFWIFYDPPLTKELSVESQKMMMPHIKIPLAEANPAKIRAYLVQYMPEKHQEESLVEHLIRYFKL